MAEVELIAGTWEGSKPKRKLRKAVSEYPLSVFGPSFKAKLSHGSRGLMVEIRQEDCLSQGGEHWDIAIAELVGEWITQAEAGQQDLSSLDYLAAHLEEQAARLRAVMARSALENRSLSISGRRQFPSPKSAGTKAAPSSREG